MMTGSPPSFVVVINGPKNDRLFVGLVSAIYSSTSFIQSPSVLAVGLLDTRAVNP